MAAFQPIEDAGPRLAFGVIHFLRVFVAAASPGVLEENPSWAKTALGLLQIVEAKSGTRMEQWFSGTSSEDKKVPGNV